MGAQQAKERGAPPGGGGPPPNPPPLAGRLGERQGSRIKGLRPRRDSPRAGGNIFTEHSGKFSICFTLACELEMPYNRGNEVSY